MTNKVLFFLLVLSLPTFAQKTIQVKSIIGTAYISGDISPKQAKIQALNDAKINALKAAGIGEHISSYQMLFSSQQKNDFSQFFSSDVQTEIQGAVQQYTITSERVYCKSEFEIVSEVTIDATVIAYDTKPDNSFDTHIEGIKSNYNNDDKLQFTLKTTQDCYVTVFNITDKEAFLLYPNAYERQKKIEALATQTFPTVKIDYALHTDLRQETNRLIFVCTKTPMPFIKMDKNQLTTNEDIFSWLYSIMPDQRKTEYITLLIQK